MRAKPEDICRVTLRKTRVMPIAPLLVGGVGRAPSVVGMTDLSGDGYLELKRRSAESSTVGIVGSSGGLLRSHLGGERSTAMGW